MNFKRNQKYFKEFRFKGSVILIGLGIILLVVQNNNVKAVGVLSLLVGIAYIVFQLYGRPSDADIDQIYASPKADILKKAYNKLGVDEDQVQEIAPIILGGLEFTNTPSKVIFQIGKDKSIRSSNYEYTVFLFSSEQVYCYELQFSLIDAKVREATEEYFYSDIVSASTVSKSEKLTAAAKPQEVNYEYFQLTTSGGTSIAASISDPSGAERQINGMKQLLRNKKLEAKR